MGIGKFIKTLNMTMIEMCLQSPAVFLFFRLIEREMAKKLAGKLEEDSILYSGKLIQFDVPKTIKILPIDFSKKHSMYEDEIDDLSKWLQDGEDIEDYFQKQIDFLLETKGQVVKRIVSISEDFTKNIIKIADDNKITFQSVVNIYSIMAIDHNLKGEARLDFFLNNIYPIMIPTNIPVADREQFVFNIADNIYNLLTESLWVIAIIDCLNYLYVKVAVEQSKDLQKIKKFLLLSSCFKHTDQLIFQLNSAEEVKSYVAEFYPVSEFFVQHFFNFIYHKLYFISKKLEGYTRLPIKFTEDYQSPHYVEGSKNSGGYEIDDAEKVDDPKHANNKNIKPKKARLTENYREKEIETFLHKVFYDSLSKKLKKGIVMTYGLSGDPKKLIKYMMRVFFNAGYESRNEYYAEKIKSETGISSKTIKRYEKGIINGKIKIQRPEIVDQFFKIHDLSLSEIDIIKENKILSQKHQKEGYLNQKQLIKLLQSDDVFPRLESKGISLKKCGATKLKRILKQLQEDNSIPYGKEKSAVYYKEADFITIAQAVANAK
jgi:hypothetical protein